MKCVVSILPESLNRDDVKTKFLLLLVSCIGFSCTEYENPLALISTPAGKAYVDSDPGECLAISWSCDAEVDSVWTVFYGSDYRFQAHGERVLFSHYIASTKKKRYWASETSIRLGRVRSGFRSGDGTCGIWSEAIDNDSSVVRIYKGDVKYLYRDTSSATYVLSEDDQQYPIAYVGEAGSVRHRNFLSVHNRNDPRPAGLVEIGDNPTRAYYLPVNFSTAALDTLTDIPQDDRPYLEDSICSGDECPLSDDELVLQMHDDLYDGLNEEIEEGVRILLDRGWAPYKVLTEALVEGMRIVGIDFRDGVLFVPEVLLAANAMKSGMAILKPLLAETGAPRVGRMVIGTVKGDIHDIGKNLVTMMMEGAGFEVQDLGINNPVENYLEALEDGEVDILGMSALLTTTMPYMKVVIDTMVEKGMRDDYVVLVGGAPLNEEFGKAIGADAYCRDAAIAVETAKEFMARKHNQLMAAAKSDGTG